MKKRGSGVSSESLLFAFMGLLSKGLIHKRLQSQSFHATIWLISRDEMGRFVARNACVCNRDKGRWGCSLSGARKWVV